MKEFIEELKYNQNVNIEKGLENKVDIDYVIERLENICILEEYVKNEINWNIESLVNENYMENSEELKKIENLTNEDIQKICNNLIKNDWLISSMNETLNESIESEIEDYINRKEEE